MQSDQAMTAFMSKEHLPIINFLLVKMLSPLSRSSVLYWAYSDSLLGLGHMNIELKANKVWVQNFRVEYKI